MPPVLVQRLEEKTIVTFVDSSIVPGAEDATPLSRGDEIVSIDGVEEQKVREKLSKIIPASTPQVC